MKELEELKKDPVFLAWWEEMVILAHREDDSYPCVLARNVIYSDSTLWPFLFEDFMRRTIAG
jgi:hypothetical protein